MRIKDNRSGRRQARRDGLGRWRRDEWPQPAGSAPLDGGSPARSGAPAPAGVEREAAVSDLAGRWAALARHPRGPARPGRPARGLLRRLAAASRDEQFWALRARVLGGELLRSGLCGEWSGPHHPAEDVLPATLGLLRDRLPRSSAFPGAPRSGSPRAGRDGGGFLRRAARPRAP